jgi:hypothetical protein
VTRVLIVGNGTSLLDVPRGQVIDSFDEVVRFNSFKIQGFEEFTGTKTTTWFTCNKAHIKKSFPRVVWHSWQKDKSNDPNFQTIKEHLPNAESVGWDVIEEARQLAPIPDNFKAPSTGLLAILFFLREVESVKIVGFDWWATDKHHYGDNEKRGTLHKPEIESTIICKLIGKEKLTFL